MLDVLPIVVPVARKPKQLWSLWDMVDSFGISELNTHLVNLERACAFVQLILEPMNPEFDRPRLLVSSVPQFQTAIEGIVQTCTHAGLPLSAPVQGGLDRIRALLRGERSEGMDAFGIFKQIDEQVRFFRTVLIDDLTSHWFWYVPATDRNLMTAADHLGASVAEKFPLATADIHAAARCLALGEGTASVFHSMRVLEHALHALARTMNVTMAPIIDLENWKNIIDQIEAKIQDERKALNQQPKSHAKDARLQLLGEISVQFGYFKDAWRNHVSHAKRTYDRDAARSVWNHTRELMQKTAEVM